MTFDCPFCNRTGFKTQRGLTQHQQANSQCNGKLRAKVGIDPGLKISRFVFAPLDENDEPNALTKGKRLTNAGLLPNGLMAKIQRLADEQVEYEGMFEDDSDDFAHEYVR